jgi:hypothetical protein
MLQTLLTGISAPPDSLPIHEFMLNDAHRAHPTAESRNPFTCGLSGRTYTAQESADRAEFLARALSKELGWLPNTGAEWDKVIGIFSLNTVSTRILRAAFSNIANVNRLTA